MLNKIFLKFLNFIISLVDYKNKQKIKKFFKNNLNFNDLTIFDVGAHKGETIDLFIKNFRISKIYAFEPNKDLHIKLLKNKIINSNKIELSNYGLGNEEKVINLNITSDTASSTFNQIDTESKYFKRKNNILSLFSKKKSFIEKTQKTKIIKLSTFLRDKNISNIDVLKIDTEGFEYNVLNGISEEDFAKIKFIYFEHHFDTMIKKNYKFYDINHILIKNNFKQMYKIRMSFRKSFEYIYKKRNI